MLHWTLGMDKGFDKDEEHEEEEEEEEEELVTEFMFRSEELNVNKWSLRLRKFVIKLKRKSVLPERSSSVEDSVIRPKGFVVADECGCGNIVEDVGVIKYIDKGENGGEFHLHH
ncbi:hypothetical protein E2542_SST05208 [Spatholobus suberectus]|nr:hypothetical protein E2542_SST05208 [Spatholobus suberectus]